MTCRPLSNLCFDWQAYCSLGTGLEERIGSHLRRFVMKRSILVVLGILALAPLMFAREAGEQKREQDRLQNADLDMPDILTIPDNIPKRLLNQSRCVIVMPSLLKVA